MHAAMLTAQLTLCSAEPKAKKRHYSLLGWNFPHDTVNTTPARPAHRPTESRQSVTETPPPR